jgi:hypothetical protein
MAEKAKEKKKVGPKASAEMTKEEPKSKAAPKSEKMDDKSKDAPKRHRITHIEHHPGGGHTVRHSPGEKNEVSYAAPDLNAVGAGMQQNVGEAPPEAAAGAPGAAGAPSAAGPMPGPAGQ